jgi:hypothetical protein
MGAGKVLRESFLIVGLCRRSRPQVHRFYSQLPAGLEYSPTGLCTLVQSQHDVDGNDAVQARVAGAVHLAHPASANGKEDFLGAQALAGADSH